jgi:hypothetical protein
VVAAGEVTAVSVPLSAAVEPPDVASVSPDPVAPGGADLTVTGTGFGDRIGAHEVTLDGVALEVVDWADDRVVARVPAGVAGDEVRVRACGLRSAAAPARVLAPEPGSLTVRPDVPCLGLAFEAAEPIPGTADVLLFATCAGIPGIAGYLRPLRGVGCAFSGITHPLSRAPLAFAPEPGGTHAWVAYADGADGSIERVGLADGTVTPGPALPQGLAVRDVAFAGGVPWVLAGGDGKTVLLRDGAPVEAFGDSQAVAMTAAGDRVALAARDGFLVTADDDEVLFKKLSDCDPVAVAARGGWTAVACGGAAPGVIGVGPDGEPTPKRGTAAGPDALWLDSKGDVAFAWSEAGGSVTALHLVGTASHAVAGQVGRLLSGFPGGSRLLFSAPNGALRVLDPYGSEGGCE